MSRSAEIMHIADQFNCLELALDHIRRQTSPSKFRAIALERMRNRMRGFSFGKAISRVLRDPQSLDGFEREYLEESAGPAGFDSLHWHLPWASLIQRDLNVATAGEGGYLTDSRIVDAKDILRPFSVTARSGLEIVSGVQSGGLVPITSGKSTIHWLADETDEATESAPTLVQELGQPKVAIGLVEISHQMTRLSDFDLWIRRELLKTAGTAIDAACINGSGASGEPEGLLQVSGIGTEAGASFAHAGALSMKRQCADANVDDETITYLAPPATRELLEQREVIADTGEFVWQADQVADRAARVSTDVPAATMIAGSWPAAMLLLWGNGVEIEFNPFDVSAFKSGIIQARVLIACDVLFPDPAAFCVATSIT